MEVAPRRGEDEALTVGCLESVDSHIGAAGECEGDLAGHAHRDIPKQEVVVQHCYTQQEKSRTATITLHRQPQNLILFLQCAQTRMTHKCIGGTVYRSPAHITYHYSGSLVRPAHFQQLLHQTQVIECSQW